MNVKIKKMAISGMLGAITIALSLTPLGLIPLGFINATTMHIPCIIGAILLGPAVGISVGVIFGLSSMAMAFLKPSLLSFALYNPVISVLPRMLIGLFTYYTYIFLKKQKIKKFRYISYLIYVIITVFLIRMLITNIQKVEIKSAFLTGILIVITLLLFYSAGKNENDNFPVVVASFIGSMTNTIFVLGGTYLLYGAEYMAKLGKPAGEAFNFILSLIITLGIPEAVVCVLIVTAVVKVFSKNKIEFMYNKPLEKSK